jgi:anti-sigma regulatory factor (Ser/Thr protein kinase)
MHDTQLRYPSSRRGAARCAVIIPVGDRAGEARGSGHLGGGPWPAVGIGGACGAEYGVSESAWLLQNYLEFGALPTAVPCARLHCRQVVMEWNLRSLASVAELVVSELVTNAVRATEGLTGSRYQGQWRPGLPPVRLWLRSDCTRLLVQVWDGSDRMPRRQEPDPEADSGRGLWLVEASCDDWGAFRPEGSSGKVVWALL